MMGASHRPLGSAWWLGGVLAVNVAGAGINPLVAAGGAVIAPVFAAGRLSPDADVTWLRHLGHRQATHRPDTTAVYLTAVTLLVWLPLAVLLPGGVHWLAWAPVAGWWSHLAGDYLFGRIPVGRRAGAVLARVLPARHVRQGGRKQAYWVGVGLDTDGLLERGNLRDNGDHHTRPLLVRVWLRWLFRRARPARPGLRRTARVLPFAPTTSLLRGAVVVLYATTTLFYLGVTP